jgi:flap endonuclease-1
MGIRGLHICIKKKIPNIVKPVSWSSWENCRIGVDIQCFLYKAISRGDSPLEAIAEQISYFRKNKIRVIYIFDGKPPVEKDSVSDKRYLERKAAIDACANLRKTLECCTENRESLEKQIRDLEMKYPSLSHETKDEIKKFLYATGTMFISANCEADTLLAYWFRRGVIDAVASYDYDFIARGCRLLVPTSKGLDKWEDFDPVKIRGGLGLTQSQFMDLCVLMGSDYTSELPIVPWKSALTSLQNGDPIDVIWARHTFSNWRQLDMKVRLEKEVAVLQKAKRILNGEDDIPESMMEAVQWDKWNLGVQNPEISSIQEFKKTYQHWNNDWWTQFEAAF